MESQPDAVSLPRSGSDDAHIPPTHGAGHGDNLPAPDYGPPRGMLVRFRTRSGNVGVPGPVMDGRRCNWRANEQIQIRVGVESTK